MNADTAATKSERPISQRTLNILFTCAGRRVGLIESFRAAMNELGVAGANMEGKEARFGITNSALWATATPAGRSWGWYLFA